jgi:hypothetical protein
MTVETIRNWVGLGALVLAAAPGGMTVQAAKVQATGMSVNVSVYDDAGLGLETLKQAEEAASYVFYRAAIDVHWRNCSVDAEPTHALGCVKAEYPSDLQLRFLRKSHNLKFETAGIAYLTADGKGCYSEVFVEPVEEVHETLSVSVPNVLGQAAAHEIAHLLLGNKSHSPTGIMRAHWRRADLVTADRGLLLFDEVQAGTMRRRLEIAALARAPRPDVAPQAAEGN